MKEYGEYCELADKDGRPVPSFMEYQNSPNQASSLLSEMKEKLENQNFGSLDEINAYFSKEMGQRNSRGLSDFLGLSPEEMQRLLTGSVDDSRFLVTLNPDPDIDLVSQSRIIRHGAKYLELLVEQGGFLPLTPKGNLKLDACHKILDALMTELPRRFSLRSEDDIYDSLLLRMMMEDLGYTKTLKTKVTITKKGARLWEKKDWSRLYLELIRLDLEEYDWVAQSFFSEGCRIVQDSALFSLYMLKKMNQDHSPGIHHPYEELYIGFINAFPHAETIPTLKSGINNMKLVYEHLFFINFTLKFGLCQTHFEGDDYKNASYRTTALFDQLLLWHRP